MWLTKLYHNYVFATLAYFLVVLLGLLAYLQLPRERAPEAWSPVSGIHINLPGVSAGDSERLALDPIERMLRTKIKDLDQVDGYAMNGEVSLNLMFKDLKPALLERRIQELRREIQGLAQAELPKGAGLPDILEINSADPDTFEVLVYGPGNDDNFRRQARQIKADLQQFLGIAEVATTGLEESELHIAYKPERLASLNIAPSALGEAVQAYFKDTAAGNIKIAGSDWQVRVIGTEDTTAKLAALPISSGKGFVKLEEVADITRASRSTGRGGLSRFRGNPAINVSLTKRQGANTLALVDQIKTYIAGRNQISTSTGVQLFLKSDQSDEIRQALDLMEQHAWSGMLLVLAVTWLMLGTRLAFLTTLAMPFSLAGVFIALQLTEQSLNLSVLLGVVIVLGMLVDDAVVVIEAIGQHLRRGLAPLAASVSALREVWLPVATSSFTTMASFLPLTLMSGNLGLLMGVVPQVVCLGLLISLVQALWILPAQAVVLAKPDNEVSWRKRLRQSLQNRYTRLLIRLLRIPKRSLLAVFGLFALTGTAYMMDWVRFGAEPESASYGFIVSLEMPIGTSAERTLAKLDEIESLVTPLLKPGELRASAVESGVTINGIHRTEPYFGNIYFSLQVGGNRDAKALLPLVRTKLDKLPDIVNLWVEDEADWGVGASAGKPVSLSLTGSRDPDLELAMAELKVHLAGIAGVHNISLSTQGGLPELKLRLNSEAIQRSGISPGAVTNTLQLLAGGDVVGSYIDEGETVNIRVQADVGNEGDITSILQNSVTKPYGGSVALSQLVTAELGEGAAILTHSNYQRVLKVEADIDDEKTDVLTVNKLIEQHWLQMADRYPNVKVNFGGEIEEIRKGLTQLGQQFVLGIGLIFLIVGTQFRSFTMPILVLLKVPMAFAGLILGLLISREPISPNTLYGAVALAGIAVNSAILMFSAGHDRLADGMGVVHATVYAARRRMLPILITSFTTLVGLLPLAMTNDQATTEWRPVATAIVWGVGFSTILTLFIVPLLYRVAMGFAYRKAEPE